MSKSLGNVLTVNSLLEKWDGNVIRLAMLTSHYRSIINWNEKLLQETFEKLKKWSNIVREIDNPLDPDQVFFDYLNDDLNTPKALAYLSGLAGNARRGDLVAAQKILGGTLFLGLDLKIFYEKINQGSISDQEIQKQIDLRLNYKKDKDFKKSDEIRDSLKSQGVILNDTEEGTTWYRS